MVDKISFAWSDLDKLVHSEVINVLWFLLEHKVEESRLPPLDKKMDILNSLIQSSENFRA